MDHPTPRNVPNGSHSLAGGNSHMKTTHIIETLHGDKAARRQQRATGQRFPGHDFSFPIAGFGTGNIPAQVMQRLDARNPTLAARLKSLFGAG